MNKNSNFLINCDNFIWLNGNNHTEGIIAVGSKESLCLSETNQCLEKLETFISQNKGNYIFGFLTYDIKNEIENLTSQNEDLIELPALHFFVPESVVSVSKSTFDVSLLAGNHKHLLQCQELVKEISNPSEKTNLSKINFESKISKKTYIEQVKKIQQYIQHGDVYELNFCYEWFSKHTNINPIQIYSALNSVSRASFSVFAKFQNHYILSASPERFIAKKDELIFSQPIKGTIKRGTTAIEDLALIEQLKADPKERRENIMIVDLVRNDLSKIAQKGSVKVAELCEIYTFDTLHQMISTITCKPIQKLGFTDVIKATFPMGSMTGAPKIRAMQIIEACENTKRGLYSGSIGYIAPNGDFDFNVIIRTILYNSITQTLSYSVGSAITHASNAENEYAETLLKANVLNIFK